MGSSQDGGTGYDATYNPTGQCSGLSNSPYDGSGTNENCAWQSSVWALSTKDSSYPQKISGGDTLIITGDCEAGYNADGVVFSGTSLSYPWDAYYKPVPSGPNTSNKTKIYGSNYATCSTRSDASKLTGVERNATVLNLEGTDNFDVRCLWITDGSDCAESNANTSLSCKRTDDATSQGDWAQNGISILDSENGYLNHVYVDGMANKGVFAGRVQNLTWEYGHISGNAYAGWEGDRGDPDNWANGGTITIRGSADDKFKIQWNGCINSNPDSSNPVNASCTTQGQGQGQGDGWGISDRSGLLGGANYVFDNVDFSKNTSDGMDNLYKKTGKTTTITGSIFAHNTGNQIKIAGSATINDTIATSDCDFFLGKAFTYTGDGGFTACRAGGNTIAWHVEAPGNTLDIYGSTITGKGDVLIQSSGSDGSCNGTERVRLRNTILQGDTQYLGGDTTDDYYASGWNDHDPNEGTNGEGYGSCGYRTGGLPVNWSTSGSGMIIYATKNNDTGAGISNANPLLTDKYNDVSIAVGSPARGLRNTSFGNSIDYNGFPRTTAIGALEYGSTASTPSCDSSCSLCETETPCEASDATCYWWSTNTCNTTAEGPICASTCSVCANQSTCQASAAGCYWWSNSTCNATVEPNSCANTCSQCASESTCEASGATCYWWTNSTCNATPEGSVIQPSFSITGKCTFTGKASAQ